MIEVEIRGRLTEQQYNELKSFLTAEGTFIRHDEREMLLLKDYPGYGNVLERTVDIRLRNTNGSCEIMVKEKVASQNRARKETALKLVDADLTNARYVMKALGYTKAVRMIRTMDVYKYQGTEWQVVTTPKGLWYYEAEREAANENAIEAVEQELRIEAEKLGLSVMNPSELREFIHVLDTEVNELVAM